MGAPVKKPTTLDPPVDTRELLLSHSSDPHLSKNKHITNEQCGRACPSPDLVLAAMKSSCFAGCGGPRGGRNSSSRAYPPMTAAQSHFFLVDC